MSTRNYVNNSAVVTLVGSISSGSATCVVTNAATFPASFPWTAVIDAGTATAEEVLVTGASGTTLNITRAYDGSAAQSHASGATFAHVAIAKDFTEANSHVNATTGVHGVAGAVVGTTDTQTLTNKTLTSPTINGATLGGTTNAATVTASGVVTANDFVGDGIAPVGSISMFGGASAPTGWLLCNGAAVSRTTYAALFAVLGTTFGPGDGSTTFNLPAMGGVLPIGVGTTPGSAPYGGQVFALGDTGGQFNHNHRFDDSLGSAQIAVGDTAIIAKRNTSRGTNGTHSKNVANAVSSGSFSASYSVSLDGDTGLMSSGDDVTPPHVALNFIVKT